MHILTHTVQRVRTDAYASMLAGFSFHSGDQRVLAECRQDLAGLMLAAIATHAHHSARASSAASASRERSSRAPKGSVESSPAATAESALG